MREAINEIDKKKNFKIMCENCGIIEEQYIYDKGYSWNGSLWQKLAKFNNFETIWIDDRKSDLDIFTATCKQCGGSAKVESFLGRFC
jgi:predicted nucleic-acid-binding Zn-ribbon protein